MTGETPQVREKTSALTTVVTTVTPPALSLVSKTWKSHAKSRASLVEAPGVEPCRRYNEKPKRCAGLHKVHAGLEVSEWGRLGVSGIGRNWVESGPLGDRWATKRWGGLAPGWCPGSALGRRAPRVA
jgi:hypothetical protein